MITVRRDGEIHREEGGWFEARWHFSFDRYRDPENMGWGLLRVFNDDRLIPGAIWPLHPHRDIEGLTYVVEGTFRHEDDLGNDGVLRAGSVQRMTLGSGAWHSEQNGSESEPMRFIQMWVLPHERGLPPSVEQREFTVEDRTDRLLRAISGEGGEGGEAVHVHQDASVFVARLNPGVSVAHAFSPGHGGYLYVIGGALRLGEDGEVLRTGDAVKVRDERGLPLAAEETTELLLVDVPMADRP
ncbi:MAG TPA: pirin family protein [Actinomycetota bacterium]|nr:pirin family protein [Actinomycetota bacterium]